jgi:2-oxoglutarate dehydrogenase complex dehydrogenase (E1) component-like enzyme
VVLDIISYRRYGHNEGDEPAFTQPVMYKKIGSHPSISKIYAKQLINELKHEEKNNFRHISYRVNSFGNLSL